MPIIVLTTWINLFRSPAATIRIKIIKMILRTTRSLMISRVNAPLCFADIKLFVMLAAFLHLFDFGIAVQCYRCAVTAEKVYVSNNTFVTPMCSKFDESEEYIVDCSFSTMCLKTISTLHLQNGQKQETVTRGCAQQKDTTQVFRNKQWQQKHSVQEVYEEGCGEFKEDNLAASVKTHCYCRGDLCNSAIRNNAMTVIFALITVPLLTL